MPPLPSPVNPTAPALINQILRDRLAPTQLEVIDDSHQHIGHEGSRSGGHYTVIITSHAFIGLSPVARHRLVYDALREQMTLGIHALSIKAQTP